MLPVFSSLFSTGGDAQTYIYDALDCCIAQRGNQVRGGTCTPNSVIPPPPPRLLMFVRVPIFSLKACPCIRESQPVSQRPTLGT